MRRKSLLLAWAASALVLGLWCTTAAQAADKCEPAAVAKKYPTLAGKTVRIGQSPTTPPYAFLESATSEQHTGLDADMARAVFACIGVPIEFKAGKWSGLLPALIAGQTEVMWSNLFYTPPRAEQVDFVTYRINATSGVVGKGNPKKVAGMDTTCGLRATAGLGTVEETAFRDQSAACVAAGKPALEIFTYQEVTAGLRMLANDRADVMLLDTGSAGYMANKMPNDIALAFTITTQFKVAVGINKSLPELRGAIFDAMQILQADGTQKALMTKYFIDPSLQIPTEMLTK
jgi:polar amino acid transport system substrate-binding protein